MKMNISDLGGDAARVSLDGRLDVQGSLAIDSDFARLTMDRRNVIVDMSEVSFLASLGIRMLVAGAKAQSEKNGHLVLLKPQEAVEKVLVSTGIDGVIPIRHSLEDAMAVFQA